MPVLYVSDKILQSLRRASQLTKRALHYPVKKPAGDSWILFFETRPSPIKGTELAPNTNLRGFLHTNLSSIPAKRGVSCS